MLNWLIVAACAVSAAAAAADYEISATLDTKVRAVAGRERLAWRNESPDPVRELQFHLYMNGFREKSTLLKETERGTDELKRYGWSSIEIKRLAVEGGPDLTKRIRFLHPDDDNADDRTVMAVDLPQPVPPGGAIALAIEFYTRLPHVFERAGWHGDFYMVAQWFPKIGVWEGGRWNCHQYHATSEFYSDYGRYDVTITAPSRFVVGATGVEQSRRAEGGVTTYRFAQDKVHDFAWTASPAFLRVVRTFDPAREVSAREIAETAKRFSISESEARLSPVEMILLIQPEHAAQIERHFKALRTALKYFGLWYGAYPYRTITLVDPPYGAGAAGGMEYPTLITAGTHWVVSPTVQDPEDVIVHEFGHQFWYGLVGNNEFEEAWLDEGINTYSTSKVLDWAYGATDVPIRVLRLPAPRWLGLPRVTWDSANRAVYLADPKADSIVRNAWEFYDASSYDVNSYARPAIMLRTLENLLGDDGMARILRNYQQRWRYRHPRSEDFIAAANEGSGQDLRWFFDQFLYGSKLLDYAVVSVSSTKEGKSYRSVVRIRREGEATMPVEIRVRFTDGKIEDRRWNGQYRWEQFKFTRPAEVESVEIDPGHKVLLDANFANNSYRRRLAWAPLLKWTGNLLFRAQNALLALGGL